jgi:hypothetical protein
MALVTPLSGETVTFSSTGILLDQGVQSIRLGTGVNTPAATILYTNSNEIARISSTVGIGNTNTESNMLKVDNGSSLCGISLGSLASANRYLGISSDTVPTSLQGFQFMNSDGSFSATTQQNGVVTEGFRILSNGSVGIGTTVVPSNALMVVNGGITESYPISLTLVGPYSWYDYTGTYQATPTVVASQLPTPSPSSVTNSANYYYTHFTKKSFTTNWYPTYSDQYLKLQMPYSGIYTITFLLYTGSAEADVFVSKNLGNILTDTNGNIINDLEVGDNRLLAVEYSPSTCSYTTLSITNYFLQNDYIMAGCYLRAGTLPINNVSYLGVSLVSRSA